jgi:sirohydrochlorin ferrochelatase
MLMKGGAEMAAPALVMLSHGSLSHRVTEVTHRLRVGLQSLRPELEVNAAFIDRCPPTVPQVVTQLVARDVVEIVFVPLEITSSLDHDPAIDDLLATIQVMYPTLKLAVARPVGPEARLLNVLDQRLRRALSAAHVTELDGLVLSCAGPADLRGTALLARRARQWGAHHNLTCTVALSHEPGDGVGPAIVNLHDQGHRHVAVGSFYLTGNRFFWVQAQQALRHGAIAVSNPIEADEVVFDAVLARYSFAAMGLLDLTEGMATTTLRDDELTAVAW